MCTSGLRYCKKRNSTWNLKRLVKVLKVFSTLLAPRLISTLRVEQKKITSKYRIDFKDFGLGTEAANLETSLGAKQYYVRLEFLTSEF